MAHRKKTGDVVAMYRSGLTAEQVGIQSGVSPQTVLRRVREAGVPIRTRKDWGSGRRRIPLDESEIRRLRSLRKTTKEIAEALGVSAECIRERMILLGIDRMEPHSRPGMNASWSGGRIVDAEGYVLVRRRSHPHANSGGYVREHRLVMETKLGRVLLPSEVVDHIDGSKSNNRPDNLRLFQSNGEHLSVTLKGRVPKWTEDGKRRIREGRRGASRKV